MWTLVELCDKVNMQTPGLPSRACREGGDAAVSKEMWEGGGQFSGQ